MIQPSYTQTASVAMRILNEGQIAEIVGASFEIVETVGCRMADEKARSLLKEKGAIVQDDRVRIPRHLVQQALQTAPRGFTIYNREGERALILDGRRSYFGTSTGSPNTLDPMTGKVRPTTLEDIARGALIADALSNIDFVMPMGSAGDVTPVLAQEVHEFKAIVKNTVKPVVMLSYSRRAFRRVYEMAAAIAGGWAALRQRPFLLAYPEPITPLVFPKEGTERMMLVAEWGLPQIFGPVVQLGATGPVTMAGALAQVVAESFICLTLVQLTRPGAPCFLSANIAGFDMRHGTISPGSPETFLGVAACAEIAQYFGLPSWGVAGATDAKTLDAQAGVESAFGIITHALAGVSLVHDVGYMDGSMICGPEMLVLGDEVIGMAERFVRGITVSEETLQRDLIAKVGPGGNYLQEEHTASAFRRELWMPNLMTRERYTTWQDGGARSIRHRIVEKIQDIMETHKPIPLAGSTLEEIDKIRRKADRELAR